MKTLVIIAVCLVACARSHRPCDLLSDSASARWKADTLGCLKFREEILESLLTTDSLVGRDFTCILDELGPGIHNRRRGVKVYHDYIITCEPESDATTLMVVVDESNVVVDAITAVP